MFNKPFYIGTEQVCKCSKCSRVLPVEEFSWGDTRVALNDTCMDGMAALIDRAFDDSATVQTMVTVDVPQDDILIKASCSNFIPKVQGLYKLYDKDMELLYIGKSQNLWKRVEQHLSGHSNSKHFHQEIYWISCIIIYDKMQLDILETYLINQLRPSHNRDKLYTEERT